MNMLQALHRSRQSVWLDDFERSVIVNDRLEAYIAQDRLQGILSNFDSLERSLCQGTDYDRDFQAMQHQPNTDILRDRLDVNIGDRLLSGIPYLNNTAQLLYNYIVVQDMQLAADRLKVVHDQTHGWDGYVNLELPPYLVFDAEATLAEARRLWQTVGWSNFMLKVPGTPAMLPVIQQLISEGVNVNVTQVISQTVYKQVSEAYLAGLEALALQGEAVCKVASVVSFPVSRLDELIDSVIVTQLETTIEQDKRALLEKLLGCVAIAQAMLLYQHYRLIYQH